MAAPGLALILVGSLILPNDVVASRPRISLKSAKQNTLLVSPPLVASSHLLHQASILTFHVRILFCFLIVFGHPDSFATTVAPASVASLGVSAD